MNNLEQILALADQLNEVEIRQALDHLALRLKSGTKQKRGGDRDMEMWLVSVVTALQDVLRTGTSQGPTLYLVKRVQSDSWTTVKNFMAGSGLATLKVVERQATYNVLAKLLVRHAEYVARKAGVPLSPKLVFNCVGNLPGLFDSAFPGYLASGLAKVVVTRKVVGI